MFEEVKRKIEAGEPPYEDTRDPEYADEPAFLEEWERADAALAISGAACLDLLQSTLHAFLDEYMDRIGKKQVIPELKKMGQNSWFGNYKAFFANHLEIDWAASGADIALIEQVIVARTAQRRRHNAEEWLLRVAGAASIGFALVFLALGFRWIAPQPGSPALTLLWLGAYFGFTAICMLGLALRSRSGPAEPLPLMGTASLA